MATKTLNTRIALKYDSYENWLKVDTADVGGNLVLLAGEIGICEIPGSVKTFVENGNNVTVETAPTVLFKVGGAKYPEGHEKAGQLMAFKDLPWASAKAADVYSWAKSDTVVINERTVDGNKKKQYLEFKTGETVNHEIDLSRFATGTDVETINGEISALEQAIADIKETLFGTGDGEGDGEVVAEDFVTRLNLLKAQLDTINGDADTAGSIAKAEADAKAYADSLAGNYDASGAAAAALAEAKTYADGKAATNAAGIASLETSISTEASQRAQEDGKLDERLSKVEAFFIGAAEDEGEGESLKNALDTLKEIQDYITTDGEAAADILTAISNLNDIVKDGGTLEVRVDAVENTANNTASALTALTGDGGRIATAEGKISTLEGIVNRTVEGETVTIRTDVQALQTLTSDSAKGNEALYTSLTNLTNTVNNSTTGLAATYAIANKNKEDIEKVSGRVGAIEGDYLKAADELIFQCGTSSTVTHEAQAD